MKGIDWKIVISSSEMKQTFALEVRNRFDALAESSDDIETTCNKLIQSTEEIALATLPKKEKSTKQLLSAHSLVKNVRNALLSARRNQQKPTSKR